MNINNYVNSEFNKTITFFDKYDNVKNYVFWFNIPFYIFNMLWITYSTLYVDNQTSNQDVYLFYSFFGALGAFTINLLFSLFQKPFIKNLYRIFDNIILVSFFNKKQKKESIIFYNKLNKKTQKILPLCSDEYNKLNKLKLKYYLINHYIEDNIHYLNYKDVILFINNELEDTEHFEKISNQIFSKINKSNFLTHKKEITDWVFETDLNKVFKKYLLTAIKEYSEETIDEEIKELYEANKKINVKQNLVQI